MSGITTPTPLAPQGNVVKIGIPDSVDIPRLVFCAPYFEQVPLAELIEPSVLEAVEGMLPSLVPPYVNAAAIAAVQQNAVLLTGSTMSGPLFLNPVIPTQPSQAASMAYVDAMLATAGIPEVPPVPAGQVWARETGQWVPISQTEGTFLPLSGGTMTGNISMSGNTINNLASVPALPNGAAPAQWVLNQIASVSLYQGTWNADTNVPDLTQLMYRVNGYTWIAITTSVSGVVVGQAIPGLQGVTVYNGDTIIYSTVQGQFTSIHAGGLTLPEADARYVQLTGSQMSGALLLNANATDPLQAVTLQQMQAAVATAGIGEAPTTGQLYGRNGLTTSWAPVLPLAGGILTGALTLSGNATQPLQAVPYQQLTSTVSAAVAGYLPLTGGTMSGLLTLSGNATGALNAVPLQQLSGMLAAYMPVSGGTFTGPVTVPAGSTIAGYLPLSGGTVTGTLVVDGQLWIGGTANNFYLQDQTATLGQRVLSWAPGWADIFTTSTGTRQWLGDNNTMLMQLDLAGNLSAKGNITATGNLITDGAGVVYAANSGNAIRIDWYQGNAYLTVDGTNNGMINLTPSDERLKSNIIAATEDCLGGLTRLDLYSYDIKINAAAPPQHVGVGFVAQQMQPIIPEAVGEGPASTGATLSVQLLPLLARCVGAIQQLSARVSALDGKAA